MTWDAVYAHCVQATKGKLDREPWYRYEQRLVLLTAEKVLLEYEDPHRYGFKVYAPNGACAIEETLQDAVQSVLYLLMSMSREAALTEETSAP